MLETPTVNDSITEITEFSRAWMYECFKTSVKSKNIIQKW